MVEQTIPQCDTSHFIDAKNTAAVSDDPKWWWFMSVPNINLLITNIWRRDKVSNVDLWKRTSQDKFKIRNWRWIGHTLKKPATNITLQGLKWNPPKKTTKRGRPRNSWRKAGRNVWEGAQLGKSCQQLSEVLPRGAKGLGKVSKSL